MQYVALILIAYFYFVPFFRGLKYLPEYSGRIFIINLLLGWTVVGYFGLLLWIYFVYQGQKRRGLATIAAIEARRAAAKERVKRAFDKNIPEYLPDGEPNFAAVHEQADAVLELIAASQEPYGESAPASAADNLATDRLTQIETATEVLLDQHMPALRRRHGQLLQVDSYGVEDDSGWRKEVRSFIDRVAMPYVTSAVPSSDAYSHDHIRWLIELRIAERFSDLESDGGTAVPEFAGDASAADLENWCLEMLGTAGWAARLTAGSGDQGIDVIAERNGRRLVIQCKCYKSPVGNSAVQEIIGGMAFEDAAIGAVVTTSAYTRSARALAARAGVHLLHVSELRAFAGKSFGVTDIATSREPADGVNAVIDGAWCSRELAAAGWSPKALDPTKGTGFVVAHRQDLRMVVVCRCDNRAVGRAAVEEVLARMATERAVIGAVVAMSSTNYTRHTRELAEKRQVYLLASAELKRFAGRNFALERARSSRRRTGGRR